ncbi:hypothetical protein [Micromonospora arborensis]|uniref:hypothetical protein n=1 Tax=Micromonospora arborensis TaxID=2116518 RepID=UPI0037143F28
MSSTTPDTNTAQHTRAERALGEIRTLLRDWRQYDDAALIGLLEGLLQHYGFWDDDDHDAAQERRAKYTAGVDPELCAYDGQNEPQKRPLNGRDRDILCRVLGDVLNGFNAEGQRRAAVVEAGIRVDDVNELMELRFALDPRND